MGNSPAKLVTQSILFRFRKKVFPLTSVFFLFSSIFFCFTLGCSRLRIDRRNVETKKLLTTWWSEWRSIFPYYATNSGCLTHLKFFFLINCQPARISDTRMFNWNWFTTNWFPSNPRPFFHIRKQKLDSFRLNALQVSFGFCSPRSNIESLYIYEPRTGFEVQFDA